MFRTLCSVALLAASAQSHALTYTLANTNSDHGDGGYVVDYQWATDATYGDYWKGFTIIGADRSAWMSRTTSWATFIQDTTTFGTTFAQAATVSFDWSYTTSDSDLLADSAGYVLNGVTYTLNSVTSASASGHVAVTVAAGDSLSWFVASTDELGGRGILATTNVVLSAVPEPYSGAMLLAGLGIVGLFVQRRRPSSHQG